MLQHPSDLSSLDTKDLQQQHAEVLEQMRGNIRRLIELEEELCVRPHQLPVKSMLHQHRRQLLEEVGYYLERMGIEEEIQSVVRRRSRQLRYDGSLSYLERMWKRQSEKELLDTD